MSTIEKVTASLIAQIHNDVVTALAAKLAAKGDAEEQYNIKEITALLNSLKIASSPSKAGDSSSTTSSSKAVETPAKGKNKSTTSSVTKETTGSAPSKASDGDECGHVLKSKGFCSKKPRYIASDGSRRCGTHKGEGATEIPVEKKSTTVSKGKKDTAAAPPAASQQEIDSLLDSILEEQNHQGSSSDSHTEVETD